MEYDVVAIGSATVDQFADTDSELIRIETPTMQEKLIKTLVRKTGGAQRKDEGITGGGAPPSRTADPGKCGPSAVYRAYW